MVIADFLLGAGVSMLIMLVICSAIISNMEKKFNKKLKNLEEKAELKAYRQIMKNLSVRKEI